MKENEVPLQAQKCNFTIVLGANILICLQKEWVC
jgi:hypothetical protein